MREYLKIFNWTEGNCEREYFEALNRFGESNDALRKLWKSFPQHRDELGKVILLCLKALGKTGVNHKGELDVFLSSAATPKPELATLIPKEHSWIGLLKDSVDSCCMVAFGDDCLEFDHPKGVSCERKGRSVFRTALVINQLNKPKGLRKKRAYQTEKTTQQWDTRWSVSAIEMGSDIWLGEQGTLRLLHLRDATLLMDWRNHRWVRHSKRSLERRSHIASSLRPITLPNIQYGPFPSS
jgi:hypothetical protein